MLQWFRSQSRAIAAAALVSLTTLTVWSAAPHGDDCHEAVCAVVVAHHDPSAHGVGRDSGSAERPLHCVLCHWTRIVRPSTDTPHHIAPAVEAQVRWYVEVSNAPQSVSAAQPPLRAPPLSPADV